MNRPEDAKKDFLRKVEGLFSIAEQIAGQLDHGPLVLSDELRRRPFVARGTALHKRRFAIADVRPTDDARLFHPSSPKEWRA